MNNDVYAELKAATPQELLEALILFWAEDLQNFQAERFLRLGFAVAQPGGWDLVAPVWLRDLRAKEQVKEEKGQ